MTKSNLDHVERFADLPPRETVDEAAAVATNVVPLDLQRVRNALKQMVGSAHSVRMATAALAQARELDPEGAFSGDYLVRFYLVRLEERARTGRDTTEDWAALLRECPGDVMIVRGFARSLVKQKRTAEALDMINACYPESDDPAGMLSRAELLDDINAHGEADRLFSQLIARNPRRETRVSFAKRLRKRGMIGDAMQVIAPVIDQIAKGSKAEQLALGLIDDHAFFSQLEQGGDLVGKNVHVLALKHALLYFREARKALRPVPQRPAVALVTGSLGLGGAERQMTRLASMIRSEIGDHDGPIGRVDVIVKQHSAEHAGADKVRNFFVADLEAAGVDIHELNAATAISPRNQGIVDPTLLRLLEHVPPQVNYGCTRLLPWLTRNPTDVVSLWQDGCCLFGALAALIAGAPVIHLVFRGQPPNIRRERFRPEYEALYRALAEIPGVHFVSNSRAAARAYAEWLDLPLERFEILYNGVPPLATAGNEEDHAKWDAFARTTPDAVETIGGVFRAEADKRPLAWVRLAQRYLRERPQARFIHVGGGRLIPQTVALAQQLGIADRLLFVGETSNVGFWYSRMNVKVLLSRFEGMPNVLIEAQTVGVPVVSTPAGGAEECFVHGETGHLLDCAESPDLSQACKAIAHFAQAHASDHPALRQGQERAIRLFSPQEFHQTFLRLCQIPPKPVASANSSQRKPASGRSGRKRKNHDQPATA